MAMALALALLQCLVLALVIGCALGEECIDGVCNSQQSDDVAFLDRGRELNWYISRKSADDLRREVQMLPANKELYPLHGWLIAVKDNINTKDMPTSSGTRALKLFTPADDAPVVARLRQAGAVIAAKANMHEMAFGMTSNNQCFGAVKNSFRSKLQPNEYLIPGGSSGGSAVAVAVDAVRVAIGSDTGGSGRMPASFTGVLGFRPTIHRYPSEGIFPLSHTRDTASIFATTVEEIQAVDAVLSGEQKGPSEEPDVSKLTFGISRKYFFENIDKGTASVIEAALQTLRNRGIRIVEQDIDRMEECEKLLPVVFYEFWRDQQRYIDKNKVSVGLEEIYRGVCGEDVKQIIATQFSADNPSVVPATRVGSDVYQKTLDHLNQLSRHYENWFLTHKIDFMLYPTTPIPATPIAAPTDIISINGKKLSHFYTHIHNTDPTSNFGAPSISMNAGFIAGSELPVGLEMAGPRHSDRRLLAVAKRLCRLLQQK